MSSLQAKDMYRLVIILHAAIAFCVSTAYSQTQVTRLTADTDGDSYPQNFRSYGEKIFFSASTLNHGAELWCIDGTDAIPRLVKDINQGAGQGTLNEHGAVYKGRYYFSAQSAENNWQVWKTDGAEANTVPFTTFQDQMSIEMIAAVGDWLFIVSRDGESGRLWRSDGTAGGTELIADGLPKTIDEFAAANQLCFMIFDDGSLWRSDGTTGGTYLFKNISAGYNTKTLFAHEDEVYFGEATSSTDTLRLYKTDGESVRAITIHEPDEVFDEFRVDMVDLIASNGKFYAAFFDKILNWYSIYEFEDGDSAAKLIYEQQHPEFYHISRLYTAGDALMFCSANEEGDSYLYKMDLTTYETDEFIPLPDPGFEPINWSDEYTGVNLFRITEHKYVMALPVGWPERSFHIVDINSGELVEAPEFYDEPSLDEYYFTTPQNEMYFTGETDETGVELWTTDGVNRRLVKNINTTKNTLNTRFLLKMDNNDLLFSHAPNEEPERLLKYDHDKNEVVSVHDFAPSLENFNPSEIALVNNTFLFSAVHESFGVELWKSDGSRAGTNPLIDFNSGEGSSNPEEFAKVGNNLYLVLTEGTALYIVKTDGYNFHILKKCDPSVFRVRIIPHKESLYFFLINGDGTEWWKSDGTESGTTLIGRLQTMIHRPFTAGDYFYFWSELLLAEEDRFYGYCLFRSDGSEDGTIAISDTTSWFPIVPNMAEYGDKLIFTQVTDNEEPQIWITDGTREGTVKLLEELSPFPYVYFDNKYTVSGEYVYFVAGDDAHGLELWKTDGTAEGTALAADINPGKNGSNPDILSDINDLLYFSAATPENGAELYMIDGDGQPQLVVDLNPGANGSNPRHIAASGDDVYFVATTEETSWQLWKIPINTIIEKEEEPLSVEVAHASFYLYPNPAGDLVFAKTAGQIDQASIYDLNGRLLKSMPYSHKGIFVGDLKDGIYLAALRLKDGEVVVKKLVKMR